jgi:hypothetical protein
MDELSDEGRRLLRSFAAEDRPSVGRRARVWLRLRSPTTLRRRNVVVPVVVVVVVVVVVIAIAVVVARTDMPPVFR